MSETLTVQASLNMRSNVPEVMAQVGRAFREINEQIKSTQEGIGRFAAEIKELTSSTRGINRLVAGFEKLANLKMGGTMIADMERMTALTRTMAESQQELAAASRETAAALRAAANVRPAGAPTGGKGKGHGANLHAELGNVAMGLQMGGDAGTGFMERAIMANFEVEHLLSQFRQNNGVGDKDIAAIKGKAEALVRSVPGSTIADNLHSILDLFTITASVGEALAGSTQFVTSKQVLASLPGAHHGDAAYAGGQAIEVMQRFYDPKTHAVDIGAFNRQLAAMTQVAVGTGGRVDGSAYLGFAKQARLGGMLGNDQFLYKDLPAMLIALGGNRAGTGDAAVFRQFIQGRMTASAADQLESFGLLDKSAQWKHGQVRDMLKHLKGAQEFVENPVQWTRDVLLPQFAAKGIDPNNRMQVGVRMGQWASTATGLGFLSEMALGMSGINKEGGKIANTSSNPMANVVANDPMQKLKEFNAAENELLVTLGGALMGPAIDSLKALTGALREMSDWAKAHPAAAKDILVASAGMAVLAKVAGDLGMALFIGAPVVTGFRALAGSIGLFGPGAPAGGAVASLAGAGGLWAVAGGLVALGAAVVGLPVLLKSILDFFPKGTPNANMRGGVGAHGGGAIHHGSWSGAWDLPQSAGGNWWGPPGQHNANMRGGTGRDDGTNTHAPITIHATIPVYLDGKKIAGGVAKSITSGLRTATGPTAGDMRAVATPAGATAQ